jgi:hypothetical protein
LPRSRFDEGERAVGECGGEAVGEAHGVAQVINPVLRIGGLCRSDPRAGEVRQVWHLRCGERDLANRGEELGQDRIEQRAVRSRRERNARARDAVGRELVVERVHVGRVARYDALVERVDGGQRDRRRKELAHLCFGQRHRKHGGTDTADARHELRAGDHQEQRVLEAEHAAQVRSRVFAEAVPHEGARRDAPRNELLGQCHRRDEDSGQRRVGLAQRFVVATHGEQRREVEPVGELLRELDAFAHDLVIGAEPFVEPGAHAHVLCAAAREHERHTRSGIGGFAILAAPAIGVAQLRDGDADIGCADHAAVRHGASAGGQRERDVGQVGVWFGLEEVGEADSRVVDSLCRTARQREHLLGRGVGRGIVRGRFFDDDVRVGAADTERADTGAPRRIG